MRRGESGHAVRLIQKAMIDLGIDPLTLSVKKYGTVDGLFGSETVRAVKKYQRSKGLKADGIVGKNTLRALDADLPTGSANLRPLPAATMYVVPGAISIFDQVAGGHPMGCWAYSYAMMLSWKRRVSMAPADAIAELGEPYVTRFNNNSGLSHSATSTFYRDAGMAVEPLRSMPMSEWADLLRWHGPVTIHAVTDSLSGGHVRIIYGVRGDGTPRGTSMMIIDPWNGRRYDETFEKFLAKYEGGGAQVNRTAQLGHW
jgi:hypothetical protein